MKHEVKILFFELVSFPIIFDFAIRAIMIKYIIRNLDTTMC